MKKWSRREFLAAGMVTSIAGSTAHASMQLPSNGGTAPIDRKSASHMLNEHERDLMRIAMDEMIPASDGMPAASQVGGVAYIERLGTHDPKVGAGVVKALTIIENISHKTFQASFLKLAHEQRVETLSQLERQNADLFKVLRDSVYEAYYEQPQVWKAIDYRFYATNSVGPPETPFDAQILAEVSKRPGHYREI